MFYEGHVQLQSLMRVQFEHKSSNPYDRNAIVVKFDDHTVLGHLERRIAAAIALLMGISLPGLVIMWVHLISCLLATVTLVVY